MSDQPDSSSKHVKKSSRTDDDAPKSSTEGRRGAFGRSRASSSKQLSTKKLNSGSGSSGLMTAEEKAAMRKMLLEAPEKKKSDSKDASTSVPETDPKASQSSRPTIKPLDEATQEALKKKSKRTSTDLIDESHKSSGSKTKKSKEPKASEPEADDIRGSSPAKDKRRSSQRLDSPGDHKKSRKSGSGTSMPSLPMELVEPSLPTIPASPTPPPTTQPPLTPIDLATSAAIPQPLIIEDNNSEDSDDSLPPPPPPPHDSSDETLPPPPPPHDSDEDSVPPPPEEQPAQVDDHLDSSREIPPPPVLEPETQHALPAPIPYDVPTQSPSPSPDTIASSQNSIRSMSSSSMAISTESEDDDEASLKKKKKKSRGSIIESSDDTSGSKVHTRERSSTKSRRDSHSSELNLQLSAVTPSASPARSPGSMRLMKTPRVDSPLSPKSTILVITPRGEMVPQMVLPPIQDGPSSPSSLSLPQTPKSTNTVEDDDDVPPPPPPPTIGLVPPPPPPIPNRGAIGVAELRASTSGDEEAAAASTRRVRARKAFPEVEAAMKAWDHRVPDFESRLAALKARKQTPEELLEFPEDDLLVEVTQSELAHYPPLDKDAPKSVQDAYASFSAQRKLIVHQSEWYGTKTSQKDRLKEFEIRQAKSKSEAEKAALAAGNVDIKTNLPQKSIQRKPSRGISQADLGRRTSRSIKLTSAGEHADSEPAVASALPGVGEDDDSNSLAESTEDLIESATEEETGTTPGVTITSSPATERKSKTKRHIKGMPDGSTSPMKNMPDTARGASPEPSKRRNSLDRRSATMRPSKSSDSPPAAASVGKERSRFLSRSSSGTAELGFTGQASFALYEKMMCLDARVRAKEAEKAEKERKGIFEVFTPMSITTEPSDHVQPVEPLRKKFDTRIMLHFKNVRFTIGYEAPFFISAAFYDIEKRIRISETFYADFNDQNDLLKSLLNQFYGNPEPESMCKRYLANLTYHSPSIYLIIRVSTVLHGDIDDITEPYTSSSPSPKDRQRTIDTSRQATSLFGKYQQGFGWAALQVFDERNNFKLSDENNVPLVKMKFPLSDAALFDFLHSEEARKTKTLEATLSLGAYVCTRDKFQLLNLVDSSLVHYPPEEAPSLEIKNDKAGAILKSLVKPPTQISDIVREVDVFEQSFDKPAPYVSHVHNFYIYPQSFNLTSSKIKAKTVCARIFLMKTDDGIEKSALNSIFSRCADNNLIPQAITSVWWDSTSAPLWDEIKIKLPHKITEQHHLLFVFYNINTKILVKKKEGQTNEGIDSPIGYAWLPLLNGGLFQKDHDYTVPILAPPTGGPIRDYMFNREPEYIDKEKATFTFRTHLVSTVISQDDNLGHYFHDYDRFALSEKVSSKEKKKMFEWLFKADGKVLLKFFPTLFNQLFSQLCNTRSLGLQQLIFRVIVHLALKVFDLTMVSGKLTVSDALYAYATLYFDLPSHAMHNPADIIASNWVVLLEQAAGPASLASAGMIPSIPFEDREKLTPQEQTELTNLANFSLKDVSWFLFELIYKSLVLKMAATGDSSRKNITSPALQVSIARLVQFIDLHRRGVGSGFDHINRVLARTFNRLFSLTDRGFILDLIYNHLTKLEGDNAAAVFRFRFLQILCDYEHYVPLNLPHYTPVDSLEVMPLKFAQNHYLAGLYLHELRSAFLSGEETKITRSKAISRFRDLLWKHHLDDRYQSAEDRSRIAGMYLPLVVFLVEHVQELIQKTNSEKKDDTERYEWCLCALWIYRYANRAVQLRPWFRVESGEYLVNLFTLLKYCLDTFQSDEPMREEILYIICETYDMMMDDLDEELQIEGSKVMEALSLSILYCMRMPKSEKLTIRLLQIVKTYVIKFKKPLFRFLSNYTICGDLTYEVFALCQSQTKRVMMCATSILYLMLRTNNDEMGHFARMKLQSTLAISRLVKREGCNYDEIRNCLEAMALYKDTTRMASWDNQIREFINRHARIIRDNVRVSQMPKDFAELKADIYYQISLEYVYSPDLRITWLSNLAQHHESGGCLVEAACCKLQIASLVAEYLTQVLALRQPVRGIPDDPSVFSHAFPSIKEEKNFSVIWLEGNTILSPQFSEDGFVKALNEASELFIKAEDLESAAEVQLILANYFKENRRWEMLAPLGGQISSNASNLYQVNRAQSRVPPNFYRVAFHGKGFEEDDGKEYIYRMNPDKRLADFTSELKERYVEKFGAENLEILQNKPIEEYEHVDLNKKNYLQIVACEIYYEYEEITTKDRLTYSDRSFDVKKFCFETPYNPGGGKPSEEVSKTWKRKIILCPAKSFPYLLSRVPVKKKEVKILKPIESAVDLLLTIVSRFKEALNCVPPNTKTVQIILQGSVLTQVNAGPLAIIREFLGNAANYPENEVKKIGEQVKAFIRLCQFGLRLNATLIEKEPAMAPLHEEMSKAFKTLNAEAAKHLELK